MDEDEAGKRRNLSLLEGIFIKFLRQEDVGVCHMMCLVPLVFSHKMIEGLAEKPLVAEDTALASRIDHLMTMLSHVSLVPIATRGHTWPPSAPDSVIGVVALTRQGRSASEPMLPQLRSSGLWKSRSAEQDAPLPLSGKMVCHAQLSDSCVINFVEGDTGVHPMLMRCKADRSHADWMAAQFNAVDFALVRSLSIRDLQEAVRGVKTERFERINLRFELVRRWVTTEVVCKGEATAPYLRFVDKALVRLAAALVRQRNYFTSASIVLTLCGGVCEKMLCGTRAARGSANSEFVPLKRLFDCTRMSSAYRRQLANVLVHKRKGEAFMPYVPVHINDGIKAFVHYKDQMQRDPVSAHIVFSQLVQLYRIMELMLTAADAVAETRGAHEAGNVDPCFRDLFFYSLLE